MSPRRYASFIPLLLSLAACASPAEGDTRQSTFAFTPDEVTALREPTNAPCGVNDTPYEDADVFVLRPSDNDASAKVSAIALRFGRTSPKSSDLVVDGRYASSSGDGVFLEIGVPPAATDKRLASAKVIVGDLPAKDGDVLSARVVLEFADGDVLAETISAPVKSAFGPCPTGG